MDLAKHGKAEYSSAKNGDAHEDNMALVATRKSCPAKASKPTQHCGCTQKYQQPI